MADLYTQLQNILPSENTRQRLCTLCQDQGELTLGQRVDWLLSAYDALQAKVAELEKRGQLG